MLMINQLLGFGIKSAYSHINGTKYEYWRKNLLITFLNS